MRRFWAASLLATSVLVVSPAALSQQRDPVAAEALFRAGRDLAKKGDYAAACPKFAESYELDPSEGTLLNLADCEERIGQLASAWSHFQSLAQRLSTNDERYAYARQHIAALEPRLPKIAIKLSAKAPPGATVTRDRSPVGRGSLGFPVPVDPGEHVIVVSAPGYEDRRYTVTVKEAQIEELEVEAGPKLPEEPETPTGPGAKPEGGGPTPTPQIPKDEGPSAARTAGWVSLGMGGAGLVVGAIFGAFALDKKSELSDYGCANDSDCEKDTSPNGQDSKDAADAGKRFAAISTIGFAVGAVGVGLGTYLILSSSSSGETRTGVLTDGTGAQFVLQRSF